MPPPPRIRTDTILLTAGLLLLAYLLGHVLLLFFAAVLLAVGLDGLARAIARRLSISRGWALVSVSLCIMAFTIGALALSAVRLILQLGEVVETVIGFAQRLHVLLVSRGVMDVVKDGGLDLASSAGDLAGTAMSWGVTAVGAISSLAVILVLTVFLVANPDLYRRGAVLLVPPGQRNLVEDTLSAVARSLRGWFLGQIASMALLGVTVGLGLFGLGIDLWLALAVLTALLTFVPFLGPLVATVPIVAVAFAQGSQTGLIVLAGYIVIQTIEGNFITPMIQQQAVDLAPALLIATQVLLSLVFGLPGLILAAPLTIVAMVMVRKLWVEHMIGENVT
jgi:predicted PurR-regulated permease PerM